MKLIVGLGNPGPQYAGTRHNAGFEVADRLALRYRLAGPRSKFQAEVYEGVIADEKVMLLKPMTFMNLSGRSVGEAVTFYKVAPADVLVIVDDIALECGQVRLRGDGSPGGHNGLKDIEKALGTREYPRLRLGVDAPGRIPQVDYVLGRFSPDQRPKFDLAVDTAVDVVEAWVREGLDRAMTRYNTKQRPAW